jgi:uncharacterized protein YbbC (DUF1343 family)
MINRITLTCVLLGLTVMQLRADVRLGIDVLEDSNFEQLAGKKVGLVANPASVDSRLVSTAIVLNRSDKVKLVSLFGPEHGLWGEETGGTQIADRKDPVTGLPVYSLYGKTRQPTKEMLAGLDALLFDLQDIGARSYTYAGTMVSCLRACAEHNVELIILDRPNPLGGNRIEGPMLTSESESLVARLATPYVHGMTMGELALLMRDRVAPDFKKLTIVKMKGWNRDMTWGDTNLRWVPTSPQIPQWQDSAYYVATGIIGELLVLSNGVGYTLPFEVVGAPDVDGQALADALNNYWTGPAQYYRAMKTKGPYSGPGNRAPTGLRFRPINYRPLFGKQADVPMQGVQVYVDLKSSEVNLIEVNFRILEALDAPEVLKRADPKRFSSFDKVMGSSEARDMLAQKKDLAPLFAKWRQQCETFRKEREKFLQY